MLSGIMLSVIMLSVIALSVNILSVIMLCVAILTAVVLVVTAPKIFNQRLKDVDSSGNQMKRAILWQTSKVP
jgi:hypothetical protein